jgi:PAS domain S-box-containing protein/putative nucleotidyltransferase with HDIG domain
MAARRRRSKPVSEDAAAAACASAASADSADALAQADDQAVTVEALRESERQYRLLFGHLLNGYAHCRMILDEHGRPIDFVYLSVNAAFERLTGLKDVVGKPVSETIPGLRESNPELFASYARVAASGEPETFEVELESLGMWFFISAYSTEPGCFDAVFENITQRKRAEKELRESQERLREAHRLAHIGVWDWTASTDTVIWTDELYRIAGRDPKLPAPTYAEHPNLYAPESWGRLQTAVEKALETGKPYQLELELIRPDGATRWVNAFGGAAHNDHGRVEGLHGTVQDITERKRVETDLREAGNRLSLAQRAAGAGMWGWDMPSGKLTWSPEFLELFGLPADTEASFDIWRKTLHPDDVEAAEQRITDAIERHVALESEYRIVRPDGEERWIAAPGDTFYDESGTPLRMTGVCLDITERKRGEEALRESEALLRGLFDAMPSGCAIYEVRNEGARGSDYILKYFNSTSLTIENKALDEVVGKSLFDLRPNIDEYGLIPIFQRVWQTGESELYPSALYVDEKYHNYYENHVFRLPNGEVVTIYDDVTVRKQADEELRKSEAILATAESVAQIGSWRWDLKTQRVDWSQGMFRLFAVDPAGFDGDATKVLSERVHPDDLAALQEAIASVRESGEPVPVEYRLLLPDGSERIIHGEGRAERDAAGSPEAITGYYQDVTESRKSEQRLLEGIVRQQAITEGVIAALARTVDVRDPYTAGHQRRVSEFAAAIARRLGLKEESVRGVRIAGMLHDIGKTVIPAEILSKPGRLSAIEFELVKGHSQAAYDILESIEFDHPIADIVVQHHERLDGSGYPAGLTGDEILPEARILAVADVVEAMISHRPYRAALPLDAAIAELGDGAGSRYEAVACEAAVWLFREQGFTFAE